MRPKFARHRRARQRQRLVRLTLADHTARQPGWPRPLAAYQAAYQAAATATGAVVRIGSYQVGDEPCPLLYGLTDLRY